MNVAGAMVFFSGVGEYLEVALLRREPIVSFCLVAVWRLGK